MERLKTFAKYLIAFILVFFAVGFLSDRLMATRFKAVEDGVIEKPNFIELNNIECRATKSNGYIEGTVTNKTGEYINTLTMKAEFYNENEKLMGTKNIEVNDIKKEAEKDFKFFYYIDNVSSYKIIDIEYK